MMKCRWATDVYGFYLLPFIAYSNTPRYGRAFWFGWISDRCHAVYRMPATCSTTAREAMKMPVVIIPICVHGCPKCVPCYFCERSRPPQGAPRE